MVARFGGDEFVILLPDTPIQSAKHIAERISRNIRNLTIMDDSTRTPVKVTISAGIASLNNNLNLSGEALIEAVDMLMLEAKRVGKNCIRWYEGEECMASQCAEIRVV